jgi:hypothetical protein
VRTTLRVSAAARSTPAAVSPVLRARIASRAAGVDCAWIAPIAETTADTPLAGWANSWAFNRSARRSSSFSD